MPWKTCNLMDLRKEFVELALTPGTNRGQLCEQFEISRNTGYRWIHRYINDGEGALADRSRAPKESPGRTSESMERLVVAVRKRYGWGGRKPRDLLLNMGEERMPAASTMTGIFKRHGLLSEAQRSRVLRRVASSGRLPTNCGRWTSRVTWRLIFN